MTTKKATQRFEALISPAWRPFLRVLGIKPENTFAEVVGDELHVQFGRLSHTFPLDAVESASIEDWPLWAGIGPRYVPGTIGLVGTFINVVEVRFAEPQVVRKGLPLRCTRLFVSLKDPAKFIAAVKRPVATAKAA
jgi:hypothetical protein